MSTPTYSATPLQTGLPDPRQQSARARLEAADRRDESARVRDLAAMARDQGADAGMVRLSAALDRERAACERLHALVDRELLAHQLTLAETDPLTGARMRAAGLGDLDRELDRCRRTGVALVVAYFDVVGLKTLNDTEGHGAGDELLRAVVALVRKRLRSYDLIVRLGGDEFLCTLPGLTLTDARRRFGEIAVMLAATPCVGAISTGFAELAPGDSAAQLIARADRELLAIRRANPACRPEAA